MALNCTLRELPTIEAILYEAGDRVLAVETVHWQGPGIRVGPEGESPFSFADLDTIAQNGAAGDAWRQRIREAMPRASRRDGD